MCLACLIHTKQCVNSASCMRYSQTCHHRVDQKDYLRLRKTIYGLKKTIYSFEIISVE